MTSQVKLDVTGEHCPMTFVKTKIALEDMAAGEVLELLVPAGEPLDNIPRSVSEEGHKVLSTEAVSPAVYRLLIEKAA